MQRYSATKSIAVDAGVDRVRRKKECRWGEVLSLAVTSEVSDAICSSMKATIPALWLKLFEADKTGRFK